MCLKFKRQILQYITVPLTVTVTVCYITIFTKPFCSSSNWFFKSLFCVMALLSAVLSLCILSKTWSLSMVSSPRRATVLSNSSRRSSFSPTNLQIKEYNLSYNNQLPSEGCLTQRHVMQFIDLQNMYQICYFTELLINSF